MTPGLFELFAELSLFVIIFSVLVPFLFFWLLLAFIDWYFNINKLQRKKYELYSKLESYLDRKLSKEE